MDTLIEEVIDSELKNEEIQETLDIEPSDSLGDDLPVEENDSETIQSEIIYNFNSEIDLSKIETLILDSNSIQSSILEKIDFISSVLYTVLVAIVIAYLWKIVWGFFSNERF